MGVWTRTQGEIGKRHEERKEGGVQGMTMLNQIEAGVEWHAHEDIRGWGTKHKKTGETMKRERRA